MAQGKVAVYNENLGQGEFPEIERTFLYIGVCDTATDLKKTSFVNTDTDMDVILGVDDSTLKTQLIAARQNAGQNWQAYIYPVNDGDDHLAVVDDALETVENKAEAIICCDDSGITDAEINAWHTKMMGLRGTEGVFMNAMLAVENIDPTTQSWADYINDLESVQDGVEANTITLVPQLHGNNLGVLAGRLCNRGVSIADTPMRVATGPLLGLGAASVDKNGVVVNNAHFAALDNIRYSCPQKHKCLEGLRWGDANMLEHSIGDYKVIEYMRIMLKAMRQIYLLATQKIGDRSLNSTNGSIEVHKTFFARPLREMAASVTAMGDPGEIYPPKGNAIDIVWVSKTKVKIYITLRPYECPKDISGHLALDLLTLGDA